VKRNHAWITENVCQFKTLTGSLRLYLVCEFLLFTVALCVAWTVFANFVGVPLHLPRLFKKSGMRLYLTDSQLTLVFFLNRSCKPLTHFLTEITKSLSKEMLLPPEMIFLCLGPQKGYSVYLTLPARNHHKTSLFAQFHRPYFSPHDTSGPSRSTVSSHPASLPVVALDRRFPHNSLVSVTIGQEHISSYRGSEQPPSMQHLYVTWPYSPATHFYREDGSSTLHRSVDIYLQDYTLSQTIRPQSG
jgi:hypothetical protein